MNAADFLEAPATNQSAESFLESPETKTAAPSAPAPKTNIQLSPYEKATMAGMSPNQDFETWLEQRPEEQKVDQPSISPLKGLDLAKFKTEQFLNRIFPGYAEKASPSPQAVIGQAAMLAPLGLPERLGKIVLGYFAGQTALEQPETVRQILQDVKEGNYSEAQKRATLDALQIAMVGAGAAGMRGTEQGIVQPPESSKRVASLKDQISQLEQDIKNLQLQKNIQSTLQKQTAAAGAPQTAAQVAKTVAQTSHKKTPKLLTKSQQSEEQKGLQSEMSPEDFLEESPLEKITSAAVKTDEGIKTGANHPQILESMGREVPPAEERNTPDYGFWTDANRFVTREEAGELATLSGQNLKEFEPNEPAHSDEIAVAGTKQPIGDSGRKVETKPLPNAMDVLDDFYRNNPKGKELLKNHLKYEDDIRKIIEDEAWITLSHAINEHPQDPVSYFEYREKNYGYPQSYQASALRVSSAMNKFRMGESTRKKITDWMDTQISKQKSKQEILPSNKPPKVEGEAKPSGASQSPVAAEKPPVNTEPAKIAPTAKVEEPAQKFKVGNNPTPHTLVERLEQSPEEKENNEQPVRVRNDKTGEETTVLESQLKPIKMGGPKAAKKTNAQKLSELGYSDNEIKALSPKEQKVLADRGQPKIIGMGGATPEEFEELPSAAEGFLKHMAHQKSGAKAKESPHEAAAKKAVQSGQEAISSVKSWWERTKAGGEQFKRLLLGPPAPKGTFWETKYVWSAARQKVSGIAREFLETGKRLVPKPKERSAMGKYAEALMVTESGGTTYSTQELLRHWADTAKLAKNKELYEQALKLSADQINLVRNAMEYFRGQGEELNKLGLLPHLIEDYAGQHMVDIRGDAPPELNQLKADLATGKINTSFKYALRRMFETEHDLEQAGYKLKTTDLYDKMANYYLAANNVLADRAAVKSWMAGETPDGRPYFAGGVGREIVEGEKNDALLVNPKIRPHPKVKEGGKEIDVSHEYVRFEHPAFRKWQWVEADPKTGRQIFVQGDLWIHKSIAPELQRTLGRSSLYNVPGIDTLTRVNAQAKGLKLVGFFHQVKTGSHALFHLTRPWAQPKVDVHSPEVYDAMLNGLQLFEARNSEMFSEGLSSSSIVHKLDPTGWLKQYQEYLFQDYIPRIKYATYQNALQRNIRRYGNQLSSRQLKTITANQVNSAFGELNWRLMGIDPTLQHALRLSLLAPDFQFAQHGFALQAFTKFGGEQRMAAAIMIASVYVGARIANKFLNGDPHWELKRAFSIINGNREYSIRTIATDAQRAVTDTSSFFYHRLAPVPSAITEAMTKVNAFGEKETTGQALKNAALRLAPVPLTPREDITFMQSAVSSTFGFYEKRHSDISDINELAINWRKANDPKFPQGVEQYPQSPYAALRRDLDDNDQAAAKKEYDKLLETRKAPEINKAMEGNRPFTGSKQREQQFIASLTPEQRAIYDRAVDERRRIYLRFLQLDKSQDK